jgi:hypothetical protein
MAWVGSFGESLQYILVPSFTKRLSIMLSSINSTDVSLLLPLRVDEEQHLHEAVPGLI